MYETLFVALNGLATIPWLMMIVLPRWGVTRALCASPIAPLLLGVVYVVLLVLTLTGDGQGGMASLADLRLGFQADEALLLGWVHYLAFDLMIGLWEWRDSQRLGIPHGLLVPCLIFTFILGPVGLLLYMALRYHRTRSLSFATGQTVAGGVDPA